MAKTVSKAKRPVASTRKPGRPAAAKRAVKAPAAPRLSVAEMRALIEKLEKANATLRAKSREAGRAAKIAAARIAELEDEVARLQKAAAPRKAPVRRKLRVVTQADAPPPEVTEAASLDGEAEPDFENLEAQLPED